MTPAQQMRAISLGSGGIAGAAVGLLIYAFWPQPAKLAAALKGPVAQPVFVEPAQPASSPLATQAQAAAPMQAAPVQTVAAAVPAQPATRSIAIVAAAPATPSAAPTALAPRPADTPAPPAAPAAKADDHARGLFADGLALLAQGDIAPARLLLERAAEAGEPRALLALGDSFDPTALTRLGAVGVKGDPAKAKDYYAKAVDAGVVEARERLAQLQQ